ncbi:MAG: hypothetical protein Q8910_04275 [Bacteroidota bacterium]|nr:hypothetical protein [Bacteroidota bacterium]
MKLVSKGQKWPICRIMTTVGAISLLISTVCILIITFAHSFVDGITILGVVGAIVGLWGWMITPDDEE